MGQFGVGWWNFNPMAKTSYYAVAKFTAENTEALRLMEAMIQAHPVQYTYVHACICSDVVGDCECVMLVISDIVCECVCTSLSHTNLAVPRVTSSPTMPTPTPCSGDPQGELGQAGEGHP